MRDQVLEVNRFFFFFFFFFLVFLMPFSGVGFFFLLMDLLDIW
jgi:hypothetical protein